MHYLLCRRSDLPTPDAVSSLPPGGHVAVGCARGSVGTTGIALRRLGLEVRDSLTLLGPGSDSTVVFLARKPLIGTVAQNVLEHGCGVLNIDGCRISTDDNLNGGTYSPGGNQSGLPGDSRTGAAAGMFAEGEGRLPGQYVQPSGRWPANLVLVHMDGCSCEGTKRVKATSIHGTAEAVRRGGVHSAAKGHQTEGRIQPVTGHADPDGKETIASWRCAPGCAVAKLDENATEKRGKVYSEGQLKDSGGASRFFYQASNLDEAWAWIETLLTMPEVEE